MYFLFLCFFLFVFFGLSCCNTGHNFAHATVLKHRTLLARTWTSNSSLGERERDHWGLCQSSRRFRAERDKKNSSEAHLWVFERCLLRDEHGSPCLHPQLLILPGTLQFVIQQQAKIWGGGGGGVCASGGWETCCPVSIICLLDAAMAKIAQEGSRLKSRVKEKKPHELLFLTQTRTHKAIHVRAVAACLYDVARAQTGSVHTTSAGSLGNNSSVKMSDRLLTTHTLHHLSGKKHWTAHTDAHTWT